jgi:topoisomerase-4 subunit A
MTLLESRAEMTRLILKEISEDAKRFGDERRTLLEAVAATASRELAALDEPVTVIISKNGWVRVRQGHGIDPAGITYKTGDFPWFVAESRTIWPLVVIDSNGRSYSVKVAELPGGRGDGAPLNTLIDFQAGGKLAQALTTAPEDKYLVASSGGYGFITSVGEMTARNKAGKVFLTLEKNEYPLISQKVGDGETAALSVAALSRNGRLLLFALSELKEMAKGRGLMLIDLGKDDELVGVAVIGKEPLLIQGAGRAGKETQAVLDVKAQTAFRASRARRGQEIPFKLKPTGLKAGQ